MPEWRDTTTYSRDAKERVPSIFTIRYSPILQITVLNSHVSYKGLWVMHCYAAGINTKQLQADNLEDAKAEALGIVRRHFERCIELLTHRESDQ